MVSEFSEVQVGNRSTNKAEYLYNEGEQLILLQDATEYTKLRPLKKSQRQLVSRLSLRESIDFMPWIVSRGHELGLIWQRYRGDHCLALDFGLNESVLKPGVNDIFKTVRSNILSEVSSLVLPFEPALQPLAPTVPAGTLHAYVMSTSTRNLQRLPTFHYSPFLLAVPSPADPSTYQIDPSTRRSVPESPVT